MLQVGNDGIAQQVDPVSAENLADGNWHMLTVTTHIEGTGGFQLYVDGDLVGQTPQNSRPFLASPSFS